MHYALHQRHSGSNIFPIIAKSAKNAAINETGLAHGLEGEVGDGRGGEGRGGVVNWSMLSFVRLLIKRLPDFFQKNSMTPDDN